MGAGGVIPPPATYFEKIQAVVRKYDILFIADEIQAVVRKYDILFIADECEKNGMLVRVAGDNILMSPPFIISPDEVDEIVQHLNTISEPKKETQLTLRTYTLVVIGSYLILGRRPVSRATDKKINKVNHTQEHDQPVKEICVTFVKVTRQPAYSTSSTRNTIHYINQKAPDQARTAIPRVYRATAMLVMDFEN
ncbi:hypothetical protein C3L33_12083, partial [Rhododendron williamsianum]